MALSRALIRSEMRRLLTMGRLVFLGLGDLGTGIEDVGHDELSGRTALSEGNTGRVELGADAAGADGSRFRG
jgi:hypothetical protein